MMGKRQHELRARSRPAGLDEAQMTSRDADIDRQVHLAPPPAIAPVAQEVSHRGSGHRATVGRIQRDRHDVRGNEIH